MLFSSQINKMYVFAVLTIIICNMQLYESKDLPSYVKTCRRSDPNLSECFKTTMISLRPRLVKGIPEMGLRAIDPVLIPRLKLDFGGTAKSSVSFDAVVRDLQLTGCSDFEVTGAHITYTEQPKDEIMVRLNMTFNAMEMTAKYRAIGQVLLLKFNTNGSFRGNFTNLKIVGVWKGGSIMKNGVKHGLFNPDETKVSLDIGKMNMYFDNLLGKDNKEMNDHVNVVLNENIDILYGELQPVIEKVVNSLVTSSINNVYELFPLDILYPV